MSLISHTFAASNPSAAVVTDIPKGIGAFALVILFGSLGGFLFALFPGIKKGEKDENGEDLYYTPKICDAITVPPLVGMVIFGCIARNFFGDITENFYPE